MKIHEYQARDLLSKAGIPVPPGAVITDPAQAADAYDLVTRSAGTALAVVKAQVFAGGRGKAGFVKLVRSAAEAKAAAEFMLANRMVSPQTGPEGLEVNTLLIAAGVDIAKEYYLAITTDRATRRNVLIASAEGGVEIEMVAEEHPDAILKCPIDPLLGLQPHQAREMAFTLGFTGKQVGQAVDIMLKLAALFTKHDCSLAEINPLIVTPASSLSPVGERAGVRGSDSPPRSGDPSSLSPSGRGQGEGSPDFPDGQVIAIDAKFQFDDNALFRHKDLAALHDPAEDNPLETRAAAAGLNYIALDGNIGCLVNGAGLAMATMDIVQHAGGRPANFLDVGGSASEQAVTEAFRIILSDTAVKGIMVNIFGGIMDCAVIARGVVNAAREVGFKVPLVVRLEGTNVEAGRKILAEASADLPTLQAAGDLGDAARKVVGAVG